MKTITISLLALAVLVSACIPKKPEKKQRTADMTETNPHGDMASGKGLDLDAMLAKLPEGWSKQEPSSGMRLAQVGLALAPGDQGTAEIAFFHFPGTGGSTSQNIARWQGQFTGPNGEPGEKVAKNDTMIVNSLRVITTDVTGTQLASTMGTGPSTDVPNSRLIASVIETPGGNWFVKATGPVKTMASHEKKFRDFIKTAKAKG